MSLSRREFIRNLSVAGGGLSLGFTLNAPAATGQKRALEPNAFLRIAPDGDITVQVHKVEMGQGTVTGMISLIAEELEVNPSTIRYEMAEVNSEFRDPEYYLQITGGSNAIRVNWKPLRETGAIARMMLVEAASTASGVPANQLFCEQGVVKSRDGKVALPYNKLASAAAGLRPPRRVDLKNPADFRVIGKQNRRLDAKPKVDGSASFGIDAPLPDALVAVVLRPPIAQGHLTAFDTTDARKLPGVVDIFAIDAGVAVVARNYWRARKAAEAVDIQWAQSDSPLLDSEAIDRALTDAINGDDFAGIRSDGSAPKGQAHQILQADYSVPFLAHATMEPMNATVAYDGDRAELWVGTQAPDLAARFAAKALGLEADAVRVHNQFLGGGFGRRAMPDHVFEAAQIAKVVGKPVKLVWSREDDTRHDFYRPPMKSRFTARLSADGSVESWNHRLAGPSVMQWNINSNIPVFLPEWIPDFLIDFGVDMVGRKDNSSVEGAADLPYAFDHVEVEYHNVETPVRLGAWRSVGHSHTGFVVESFVDEVAHAAGEDPIAFRRRHLPADSRQRQVLDEVERISNWGNAPEGHFQGVAVHESFQSVVAEVVEISLAGGRPKLEKAWVAVNCGQVVNPDIVRQQMESGLLFGLTAALYGEITLKDGAVVQGNFHDYPSLRMNEAPDIEVAIIDSDDAPTGVGEPATPPAPAALGNAIFAATGTRQRNLPFKFS